ncbi:GNAT family N-acetyltransferase [Amycolatopsis sp. BJA-103]|uniref:GNAT family N-acetyltransferase n=1 Tax=Amycolatopsis sp. BJA-103 TaxID=1911175 RepID=UPI000C7873D8|nr:GNAT family N-acetyltransferase [Amycolatopsis sp. BJA-103]AUI57178.1 GNAT family N-acetyltransferase [Amycolatopsis sp. BJA-103]PNE15455.1 GNAT family N-acetyltransferase [Amycolatopsis sp. BJA-103]
MTWEVRVLDPRTDAEPEGWAAFLTAQQVPVPWDYHLLRVESHFSRSPNLLTVISDGGDIVAAVLAMLCAPVSPDRPGAVRGVARLGTRWLEVQHAWLSGYPPWLFADEVDAADRREIMRRFERAVCRFTGPGCLGVVYRTVEPEALDMLSGRGRPVRETMPTSVLENGFVDVEGWLASLRRSRRLSLRGQVKKVAADPGLVVRAEAARTDLDALELATLLRGHRGRMGPVKFDWRGPVTAEYFAELVRRPDVITSTYHGADGKLLAFGIVLDHPVAPLHQHWAAVAPEEGRPKHLYFDAVVRNVRSMIEGNRKSLSMGRGLTDLKATLGFRPVPLLGVIVPRPVTRW